MYPKEETMNIVIDKEDGIVTITTHSGQEEKEVMDLFRFITERVGIILNSAGVMNTNEGKEFIFTATEFK